MKVALVTDTHFGARSDSLAFDAYFAKFYDECFFPYLEEHDINTISVLPHMSNSETLHEKVSKLLDDTEEKMSDLIHEYNESIEDEEDENEIDTVDLSSKFDDLKDYIEDYS